MKLYTITSYGLENKYYHKNGMHDVKACTMNFNQCRLQYYGKDNILFFIIAIITVVTC